MHPRRLVDNFTLNDTFVALRINAREVSDQFSDENRGKEVERQERCIVFTKRRGMRTGVV